MGTMDLAEKTYHEVLDRQPEHIDARAALCMLYQRTGRNSEAVQLADEIINLQGSRGSEEDLARLSESLELYEQAVQRYGSMNPGVLGKNLELLRDRSLPDDSFSIDPLQTSDAGEDEEFVPVDEETDPLTLYEDEELVDDSEIPFDELVATDALDDDEDTENDDSKISCSLKNLWNPPWMISLPSGMTIPLIP